MRARLNPVFAVWRAMLTPARAFQPPALEREFLADYARRFANERRAITLLAALLWLPLMCWDLVNMSELGAELSDATLFVGLRAASFCVLLLVAAIAAGPWIEASVRRHLARSRAELDRRVRAMARALGHRADPGRAP